MAHPQPQSAVFPRALLVEDTLLFERVARGAIGRLGPEWRLNCCRTGGQALAVMLEPKARFDLMLVDLDLPDMSGVEIIRTAHRHFPRTPVVAISVITAEESVLAAIRAGARGYIVKDGTEAQIADAIEQVFAGNYPISPGLARYLFRLAGAPGTDPDGERIDLSPKETAVLSLFAHGYSYAEAATQLGVAISTVQTHVRHLYRKLNAQTKIQAVSKARQQGLL